mgnify:FL=1
MPRKELFSFTLTPRAAQIVDDIPNYKPKVHAGKSARVSQAIEWYYSSPLYAKELLEEGDVGYDWKKGPQWTGKLVKSSHGMAAPITLMRELELVYNEKAQLEAALASRPPIVRERRSLLARILSRMRAWLPMR